VAGGLLGYTIGHFLFASIGEQLLSALHLTNSFPYAACKRGDTGFLAIILKGDADPLQADHHHRRFRGHADRQVLLPA
jgi:hypothetical protein